MVAPLYYLYKMKFSNPIGLTGILHGLLIILCTGLGVLCFHPLKAQASGKIDSLQNAYNQTGNPATKTLLLEEKIGNTYSTNPKLAIQYCEELKLHGEKLKDDNINISAMGWMAFLYEQQGDIEKALNLYQESLVLARKLNNKKNQGTLLNNIAAIYKDKGMIGEALEYHEKSMAIKKSINDQEGLATSLNNIGLIFQNQGQIAKALENYLQALKYHERAGNKEDMAILYHNIATVYKDLKDYDQAIQFEEKCLKIYENLNRPYDLAPSILAMGDLMFLKNKQEEAVALIRKSIDLREKIDDKQGLGNSYKALGNFFLTKGETDKAIFLFGKSLQNFKEAGDSWGESKCLNSMAKTYLAMGNYNEAGNHAREAISIAQKLGFPLTIQESAELLSEIYSKEKKWDKAYTMQKLFLQMRDSVRNEENARLTIKRNFQYEYNKKVLADSLAFLQKEKIKNLAIENRNIELKRQRYLMFSVGIGLLLISALAVSIYKGKQKSDELLLNILPYETAMELKKKGEAAAREFESVTVLFTDFKGFTQISERLNPAELVAEIDDCFSAFDEIMAEHGMEKIKTIGDAYMAAGGLPVKNKTHPVDAVMAAMAILKTMDSIQKEKQLNNLPFFEIRIGIHTGPVVAGIVGTRKFAYDIWGDTVNTASRMESSGEAGKINISGSTYALIKDHFNCTYRGKVAAKGKGEIDMYFVEGIKKTNS